MSHDPTKRPMHAIHIQSLWWLLWASYQIRKMAGCACAGNVGNIFPRRRIQRKPQVSDPGMHHGTCRDACRDCLPAVAGKTFPTFPAHAPPPPPPPPPPILRIWQEAHWMGFFPKAACHISISIQNFSTNLASLGVDLTQLHQVPHICVGELGQNRFR